MSSTASVSESQIALITDRLKTLRKEIGRVIIGQAAPVDLLMTCFLTGGHCLLEGVPGLAKTLLVRTLARAVNLRFQRVQFTPDLMPTDIIGTEILEEDHSTGKRFFKFNEGPIFTHILLADEINRTPPKTQSALLEAMAELSVTYGGNTYPLEPPFFVLATQNPIEQAGTYPLPEAQLDRFLLYIRMEYPEEAEERDILSATTARGLPTAQPVIDREEVLLAQQVVREVMVHADLIDYVSRLIRASRPQSSTIEFVTKWVRWGAGPRAGQAILLAAKARALLQSRYSITMDDVHAVLQPALAHRLLLNFKGEAEGVRSDDVARELMENVPAPRSPLK